MPGWRASERKAPVATLAELRRFNASHAATRGTLKYGQSLLDISDEIDLVADRARYETASTRSSFPA
jgi:hypothetical protein